MSYSEEQVARHAEELRVNGFTVLPDRLPAAMVERMRLRFDELLAESAAQLPTNRGAQRYQLYVPWEPPFAEPLLYEHPGALAVMEAAMEPDLTLRYFASDTPLPGSDYQQVHSDTRLLFPETQLSLPAYGIVLNVPLVDCTEENGSLEFWPATHLMPGRSNLEHLAALLPSARANLPAGSLLLRDLRMWHRGTPNRSTGSRPHLAVVYTRPWYRFELDPPLLDRTQYNALSERAQQLLRQAPVRNSSGILEPASGKTEGGSAPR